MFTIESTRNCEKFVEICCTTIFRLSPTVLLELAVEDILETEFEMYFMLFAISTIRVENERKKPLATVENWCKTIVCNFFL